MTSINTIFLDMDGVLADFEGTISKIAGVPFNTLSRREVRELSSSDGFFRNLLPTRDFGHLIQHIHEHIDCDVCILSATGSSDSLRIFEEKNKWLDEWYNQYPLSGRYFVHHSEEKRYYASSRSLLIDDRLKSVEPFIRKGGHGILHTDSFTTVHRLKEIFGYYGDESVDEKGSGEES